jgi:hypothetical protein
MRPSRFRVRQKVVPLPARVSLIGGILVVTETVDLQAIANHGCLYHRLTRFYVASPLNLIFMLGGAPEAHDVLSKTPRSASFQPEVSARGVSDQDI